MRPERADGTLLTLSLGGSLPVFARSSAESIVSGLQLVDPASPVGIQPVGQTGKTLVFSDEFAGTSLDTAKWDTSYPDTPFWNATVPGGHLTNTDEPQAYQADAISFPGGGETIMRFTMRNESTVTGLPYTSGMVTSFPSFNPIYGYFEARMRLPNVQGSWPAFWMDRTDQVWPPEIDIMENWGRPSFNNVINQGFISTNVRTAKMVALSSGDVSSWHTYAAEWRPGVVQYYLDGVLTKTDTYADIPSQQMYLICNLAGDKGTSKPAASDLPMSADVDYIRAWS